MSEWLMWEWVLKKAAEIGVDLIEVAPSVYRFIQGIREGEAQQNKAVQEFLLKFMPKITSDNMYARTCCWPNKNKRFVATDVRAAAALVEQARQNLPLKVKDVQVAQIRLPMITRSNLMVDDTHIALFGGPSANDASFATFGFVGEHPDKSREENRYLVDPDPNCPLWNGVLKYFSIAHIKYSPEHVITKFKESKDKGVQTPYIRTAKWGIAEWNGKEKRGEVLIEEGDFESTLLITRMPHFFHAASEEKNGPPLASIIVDGVHGKQTEAFRLLFNRAHVELLKEINAVVDNHLVFQIPLVVMMNKKKVPTRLTLRSVKEIHLGDPEQSIRHDVHQYVVDRLDKLFIDEGAKPTSHSNR